MEKYYNEYAISLAVSLVGCLGYMCLVVIKQGVQDLQERDIAIVFFDFAAICSSAKIVYLAFDVTICRPDSKIDLVFLALGGIVILTIALKNIFAKSKFVSSNP